MRSVTKKWIALKLSSLLLTPLMIWFAINLAGIYDKSFFEVLSFFRSQPAKILFILFIIFAYLFSSLSISEVFEDYIGDEKIKNVAINTLNIVAIFIPLITIIIIFNLGL